MPDSGTAHLKLTASFRYGLPWAPLKRLLESPHVFFWSSRSARAFSLTQTSCVLQLLEPPSEVFGRGPVLHVVKSSTESTLHCDHRIGPRELKGTEHYLLRCCHSETRAANAVSGRSDWVGWRGHDWALYWQLFETLNYALCNGMRLFPRRCSRTAKWSFEIGSFFMKDPVQLR
jgi:hypothetical protein